MILDLFREMLFPVNLEYISVLPPEVYKDKISSHPGVLLDVRTDREYAQGHLEGAVNLDVFKSADFKAFCGSLNKEQPFYLYCRSGSRSKTASRILSRMGFKEIYDLEGGILNWK